MPSIINTNLSSLNTQRSLNSSQGDLSQALERLSSGLRVNSSKDDAAGLAIATTMDAQNRGNQVAIRNATDAISRAQTAEGALQKQTDALQRMRELAVQAANGTNSSTDQANLNAEFTQLQSELSRLSTGTKFNGVDAFGSASYQIGAGTADTLTTASVGAQTLSQAISSTATATAAIAAIDTALSAVNTSRATLGAIQNRFESVIGSLQINVENGQAARSRIMDADFAMETANLTRAQILQQAGTAMLAQANQLPNNVLSLLR